MRHVLPVLLVTACGPRAAHPTSHCHVLQECRESGNADRDGCPDVALGFAAGSTEISSEARTTLNELVEETREVQLSGLLLIGGWSPQESPELGTRRATAVRDWLRSHLGQSVELTVESKPGGSWIWFEPKCARQR